MSMYAVAESRAASVLSTSQAVTDLQTASGP